MKTALLLIPAFLCTALSSIAQGPTITAANTTPVVGEIFQNHYAKTAGVDDMSGGANQTWDYSTLTDSDIVFHIEAVTPASTPNASLFPTSNLAVKTANDSAFIYFNSQTNALSELGLALTDSGTILYTTPKIYLSYPFSYNSFFTDSVVLQAPGYNIIFRGKDSLSGDGYGTLKTPGFVYNNVLRIKYIENITYSKDTLSVTTTINQRTTSYLYFTPDTHYPLLSISDVRSITSIKTLGIIISDTIYSKDVSYLTKVILPLSFVSFNASLNNNQVSLQWQTAQEINTGHFNVQRTLTGNDFKDIAEIKATGNPIVSNYNYIDEDFVKSGVPPSVYYRIKETDNDGKEFYSSTAVVHGNSIAVSLYPNPAANYIKLHIKDVVVADAVTIYDAKGRLVKQYTDYQVSQPINVSALSKGSYFIQIKIKDKTTTTTVVKE